MQKSDIIKVDPEVILRELPFGDPEKSNGTYKKLYDCQFQKSN